jgi:ABC-type transport system substrate-binding protein
MFALNRSRPLFRNNVKLRQAVNFAVDRKALVREAGPRVETPTDQYLTPAMPGYRDERIYPLNGPDLRKAQKLAKGRTRGGDAVLYTIDNPGDLARAQIVKRNLAEIGLRVEIKAFPSSLYFEKISTPGEPYDLVRLQVGLRYGVTGYVFGFVYGLTPKYQGLLARAYRLTGDDRDRAYGDLDVQISRDVAPDVPVAVANWQTFVSARVGCIVLKPSLVLTAVCLK